MNLNAGEINRGESALAGDFTLPPGLIGQTDGKHGLENPLVAMIVCSVCKHMVYGPVDQTEWDHIDGGGTISRYCHQCGEPTGWVHYEWHNPGHDQPLLFQTTQPDLV
jgi:hypothetical protein